MSNVIHMPQQHYSVEEMFLNMNKTQNKLNRNMIHTMELMNKKHRRLKAAVIAMFLISVCFGLSMILAVKKIQTTPTTVYIQGYNHTVDVKDLPIAPLEELK